MNIKYNWKQRDDKKRDRISTVFKLFKFLPYGYLYPFSLKLADTKNRDISE